MIDWMPRNIIEHDRTCPQIEFVPPNECEDTDAVPGTKGKLDTMAERVRLGQPLHHKDDGPEYKEDE
jgi:hypothetical protein